jgi:dynein heavy chain
VRDALLKKKEKLVQQLKALAARVPRKALAAVGAKFAELERELRARPADLEQVDEQRRLVEALPGKVASLMVEVEATRVGVPALRRMGCQAPGLVLLPMRSLDCCAQE